MITTSTMPCPTTQNELFEYVLHVGDETPACGISHELRLALRYTAEAMDRQPREAHPWAEIWSVERDYSTHHGGYDRLCRVAVCRLDASGRMRWS